MTTVTDASVQKRLTDRDWALQYPIRRKSSPRMQTGADTKGRCLSVACHRVKTTTGMCEQNAHSEVTR